ncbi:MAG TPA: S53 family peptidase [Terriglobales bacterium]|nr:S53 family peptidase [Terriglobales bacterium]
MSKNTFKFQYFALSLVLVSSILGGARIAYSATGQLIKNNTPPFVRTAPELGLADPSQTIEITVWLKVHNRQQLDSVAEDLYDPTSLHYRDWLSFSQIAADYGPTAQEAKTVKEFLSAHDLSITLADPNNFFVRARGTIAQVSAAFRVQLRNFNVRGTVVRANTTDPYIEGAAAPFVHLVSGLSNQQSENLPIQRYTPPAPPSSLESPAAAPSTSPLNSFFASNCFQGPVTDVLTTNGGLPAATYTGNLYDSTNIGGCGYTPPEIHTAYNLSALYKEGYDGNGQTIVIFEICNTATIQSDANAFSAQFGLPALTSANFSVIGYPVLSPCDYPSVEESLDVEWAHAIAPGANIVVLVTPNIETDSGFAQDIDVALLYTVANHLGNVMSFSYGAPEIFLAPADLDETNLLAQMAAVSGVSADFASGDDGDYTEFGIPATVLYPASTQYGTAVGGISLALNSSNAIEWQSGWGTNLNTLDEYGLVSDPPQGSFFGGSGGGSSGFFLKPDFQHRLAGSFRRLPDISWIADPYTGVVVDLTDNGVYPPREWFPIGGTSVATPMFSALWAIANQEAGTALGQAARYVYSMPSSTITDIVPFGSSTNVTGTITDASGLTSYSASDLAQPLDGTTVFYDALWNVPLNQGLVNLVTFGTDTHLKTAPGWDDVTGVGVPKPKRFADFFKPAP